MRTTITLTPEAEAIVRRAMEERGLTFKEAVNDAIVRSASDRPRVDISWPTYRLGLNFDVDKASQVVAELEDEDIMRKLAQGR